MQNVNRAVLDGAKWKVSLNPSVGALFKRLFDGVDKVGQELELSDTPANAKNLLWFSERHPIDFSPQMYVLAQASVQDDREEAVRRILSSEYKPSNPRLALPLRDYQSRGVDLVIANGALLLGDEVGTGKQQPVDTLVLTPSGWRSIGTLAVGDHVIGSDGRPTPVLGVYPQGVKPSYRMVFSDRSSVESGPDHLWTVAYRRGGKVWADLVLTTEQIRTQAKVGNLSLSKTPLYLPMLAGPVLFGEQPPLPIPPYTMGQLIANGSLAHANGTSLSVNTADWPEIRDRLLAEGTVLGAVQCYGNTTRAGITGVRPAIVKLRVNVLSGAKRIPEPYLRSSPADRVALLQGLMDGDGSCSEKRNKIIYHTTSPGLAEDVRELVEQLGGVGRVRAYDRSHEDKPTDYHVAIRTPLTIAPFSTRRKASRVAAVRRLPRRTVVGVEYVRDVESVCIRVDAKDSLYVTERCILTHNTATCIGVFARPEALPAVVVTLTALPIQWKREINRFAPELRTHIIKSSKPYPLDYARGKRVPLPDVVVMSYSKLTTRTGGRSWAEILADENLCRTLIFDEGQELRSGGETERYKAAVYLRNSATYCVLATATPVYNHGGEIHNVVNVVQPGALGDRKEFLREWCGKETSDDSGGGTASGEMRKIRVKDPVALGTHLRDTGVMLRRTREDIGRQLPPLQRIFHPIETDGLEIPENVNIEALCRTVLRAGASGAEKMKAAGELDWRLRQATGLAKAPEVASLVRLLIESGEKVVLYGWHRSVYDLWAEMFGNKEQGDLKPAWYTGTESPTKKDEARRRFVEDETDLIILSLRSGAGLDGLQFKSKIIVFGEFDWSPGVHQQDEGRVFRDGQKHPVSAYYAYTDEGSDPVVMDTLNLKTEQSEGIINLTTDVVKLQGVDPNNIRRLAEAYLRKLGKL